MTPTGPKTLCNACGVRRQRLIRKQQAAVAGVTPTAPVAAVQARRRLATRRRPGASASLIADEDVFAPAGAGSVSEQSSDEAEMTVMGWRTTAAEVPRPQRGQHSAATGTDVEDSCNEEETAAYDLLFFAGFDCGDYGYSAPSGPSHGHNTRRQAAPQRRSDDFYYYEEQDHEGEHGVAAGEHERLPMSAPALQQVSSIKRRRVLAAPPKVHIRPGRSAMTSFPSSSAEHEAAAVPAVSNMSSLPAAAGPAPASSSDAATAELLPAAPAVLPSSAMLALQLPLLPLALPALSLPGAVVAGGASPADLEMIAALHAEFQRACMQMQQAVAAAEAVGAVAAERRDAADAAHAVAAVASQRLADGAKVVAALPEVRDVLAELHTGPVAMAVAPPL